MKNGTKMWVVAILAAAGIAGTARGEWDGAKSLATDDDAHRYTNPANWVGEVIDDVISTNYPMTANFTLYFGEDRTTTANGVEIRVGSYQGTYVGTGGSRTLTLMGDFRYLQGGNATWGVTALPDANPLNVVSIDLGGGVRTFENAPLITLLSPIVGNGDVVKTGAGSLDMTLRDHTFNGRMTVKQATVKLGSRLHAGNAIWGRGKLLNVHEVLIDGTAAAASFEIAAFGSEVFNDAAAVRLRSGSNIATFKNGRSSPSDGKPLFEAGVELNDVVETMGELILDTGLSVIQHGTSLATDTNFALRLNSAALVRNNRSVALVRSVLAVNNVNVPSIGVRGTTISSGGGLAGNQIFFTAAPATTSGNIVPYLLGADMVSGGNANSFVTYDGTDGLRVLRTAEDAYGNPAELVSTIAAAGSSDNVRITVAETVSANKTVNALIVAGVTASQPATLNAGVTLTIDSGCLVLGAGTSDVVGVDRATSVLAFGTNEAFVHALSGSPTISAAISGSGGLTVAASGTGVLSVEGVNTYSGQTTVVNANLRVRNADATAYLNTSLPDNEIVLLHPGATLQIGSSNAGVNKTEEIVGGLAGAGIVRLTNIDGSTAANHGKLLIGGALSDGATREITLAGGTLSPGMPGETGTLSFTTGVISTFSPIPVVFKNGTLNIDLSGPGTNDLIAITGDLTISAGGSLAINVNVSGFTPVAGQEWTIVTAATVTDGNGGVLFDSITDNSDQINFTAEIRDGNKVVLVAEATPASGTVITIR